MTVVLMISLSVTIALTKKGRACYAHQCSLASQAAMRASALLFLSISLFLPSDVLASMVRITTSLGDIVVDLDEENAPITVANFLDYVDRDAYDNTIFHRVIRGFMVQGGGHYTDMSEAEEAEPIRNEADNGLRNDRGTISMARMNEIDSTGRSCCKPVAGAGFAPPAPRLRP